MNERVQRRDIQTIIVGIVSAMHVHVARSPYSGYATETQRIIKCAIIHFSSGSVGSGLRRDGDGDGMTECVSLDATPPLCLRAHR